MKNDFKGADQYTLHNWEKHLWTSRWVNRNYPSWNRKDELGGGDAQ